MIQEAYELLPKNGRIIALIPLQRSLYCGLDKKLGRLGRYEAWEIREMLERAGFQIEKFHHVTRFGSLLWWFAGKFVECGEATRLRSEGLSFDRGTGHGDECNGGFVAFSGL